MIVILAAFRDLRATLLEEGAGNPVTVRGVQVFVNPWHNPAIIQPQDYGAVLKVESALERKSSKVFLFSSSEP